jgi:hypothetical protein
MKVVVPMVAAVAGARTRAMGRLLLAFVAMCLLTACGPDQAAENSVTESDAYDRVESYIRRAVTALPADTRPEAAAQPSSVACKGDPSGRVIVTTTYFLRGLTVENEHFDSLLRWWQAHDFKLLDDLRPERHYVWVQNTADGFRMSLRDNEHGELLLSAESPCLTEGQ